MKRFISANASEILSMSKDELKKSIQASEGRIVLSENVCTREASIGDITNSEIARAFGADLILLNCFDAFHPFIFGIDKEVPNVVLELKRLVGCPIGMNLEPVSEDIIASETIQKIPEGRKASIETFKAIDQLGFDFVCLTGNPGTGVSNDAIISATKQAKRYFSGLIIAGKMHGAGVKEPVVNIQTVEQLLDAGADIILVPAVGTVPSFNDRELRQISDLVHEKGGLVLSAIGTSQETSDTDVIKEIAIRNKIGGVDIQHIGDAGYGGVAPIENIYTLSTAIRGVRHTISRIARSINR